MTDRAFALPASLRGQLIVSCQAPPGDPLDDTDALRRLAVSCLRGGAGGLRANGTENIRAFRAITDAPIIGIVKAYEADGEVYITPDFASARRVREAGADIVALDCTARRLSTKEPWPELIARIHRELACPVLADIATLEDALAAERAGADAVASTLFGYTPETRRHTQVSWPLIEGLVRGVNIPVLAEGRITLPEEARRALDTGAFAVVVGAAITRPGTIAARFSRALRP